MRTCHSPIGLGISMIVFSLASMGMAAERPSSIDFAERDGLVSSGRVGSAGNPLRSGTTASLREDAGNRLRRTTAADASNVAPKRDENVAPASYSRRSSGISTASNAPKTGIFSSWIGETSATKPPAKWDTNAARAASPAAKRAQGLMPEFLSSAMKLPSMPKPVAKAKAGPQQAAYQSAASAQSYRPPVGASAQPPLGRELGTDRQAAGSTRNRLLGSTATAGTRRVAAPTSSNTDTASALARAHELSSTARTEEEFSAVIAACRNIRASEATAEEAAFGRQLAAWALNRRGQVRAGAGRTDEALADFDAAIRLDAECWRAFHNRGVLQAQAGHLEQAFDDFQRTIELSPTYAKAYSNRAALYVLAGELESALADYQQALERDPELAIAHRGCGRMCHMLGRTNEAVAHLDTAIELAPNDVTALVSRGDLLTDLGHWAEAATDYERALEINPRSAEACRNSAWLLATCPDAGVRDPEEALRRAQLAARLERKSDAMTYDTLAAAHAAIGDYRQAAATIEQAIELAAPSERGVYQDRLQLYRRSRAYLIEPLQPVRQARFER